MELNLRDIAIDFSVVKAIVSFCGFEVSNTALSIELFGANLLLS
ncbi:MAG: hypothetical protein ACI94Z_002477 [Yoonia sp.]|jgi:hypothetical protein